MIVKHMNNDDPPRTVSLGEIDADATEPAQASGAFTIVPGGFQVLMGSISSSRAIELRVYLFKVLSHLSDLFLGQENNTATHIRQLDH